MKGNRWGHRDAMMVLIAFSHGLRASELVDLRWDQVHLEHALLHVRRLKSGSPATHPLTGKELRALRRLQREQGGQIAVRLHSGTRHAIPKAWLSGDGRARWRGCWVRYEDPPLTCYATLADFKLANDGVDTRERSRPISATSQSIIQCATPSWRRLGSRAYFGTNCAMFWI